MRIQDPWALWLGLAAAFVLLAHLVRRRARRHVVPFLPLWAAASGPRRGGFGAAITRYLDLLLLLLACSAVATAAAGPFVPGTPGTVRDLVLVLDGGVELRAGSRHRRLLQVAEAEVARRAPGTRIAVVAAAEGGPAVWTGTDRHEALGFVRAHRPAWTRVAADDAVLLAREAAKEMAAPDLVLCTYRPGRPDGFRLHGVSEAVANAGVASLEVVGDPEGGRRVARLLLRGDGPVEVEGLWSGDVKGLRAVDVPLPAAGRVTLRVRGAADGFAPDDAVHLLLPERAVPRVLVVAEGEPSPFLAAALQALLDTGAVEGPLDRTTPDRALEAAPHYDVLVCDRCVPDPFPPDARALYVAPPRGTPHFRVGETVAAPALFAVERGHPVLQGVDLERIPPLEARAIVGGDTVATAAPGSVLCAAPQWIALGFDPDRSILAASPQYPLLLRNCVAHLAASAPAGTPEFHAVGEPAPAPGVAELEDGERIRVRERLLGPPGFWRLGDATLAVNLLVPDLDLRPPGAPDDPLPDVGEPGRPEHRLAAAFAGAAIVLLLLAWFLGLRPRNQ